MSKKPDGYVFKNWRRDYPNWGQSVEGSPDYSCAVCVNDRMFGDRQAETYQAVCLVPPALLDWVEKVRDKLTFLTGSLAVLDSMTREAIEELLTELFEIEKDLK